MIQKIRNSRVSKVVASYLAIQMIVTMVQPSNLYALTGGPSQPEFNSFTPIGTSDMVNLSSGDFNYNIPIMDVGGYPLNLAYDSGITMDQEASWVGLGWNLNVGQINRQVRGLPDDFKGDLMNYQNNMRDNRTVGTNLGIQAALAGFPLSVSLGMGVQYNNYEGITFHPSFGASFALSDNAQVGINISSSTAGGATVSPSVSLSANSSKKNDEDKIGGGVGVSLSSRKGLESLTISTFAKKTSTNNNGVERTLNDGFSGSISYNNNNNYTPTKRAGTVSRNFSFNASLGTEIFTVELQGHIQGYGSFQKIRDDEKNKNVPSYGYSFTEFANKGNSVLDFNREKDRTFNKNTTVLPIPNHSYDIYSLQGQGLSGMFRPHRGQISYLMDNKVSDYGDGFSGGLEIGIGWNVHVGADAKISPSYSYTGGWEEGNFAKNRFEESNLDNNNIDYETVYYKMVGELNVDKESTLYYDKVHSNIPVKFDISGNKYNRTLSPSFQVKEYLPNGNTDYDNVPIVSKIKRNQRDQRNSSITLVTNDEAEYDNLIEHRLEEAIKPHHTAGIKVLKPDGSTYVYGETAYNWTKKEVTVDLSGETGNCVDGTIPISVDNDVNSDNLSDKYKNIITTPAYAHTYLLSSVLSADYEDVDTVDGPSTGDLGAYTLFNYGASGDNQHYILNYQWRTPYDSNVANYNEGLKSKDNDQKGNVIKGEKELKYIRTIETKTHVAYFMLKDRFDGKESTGNDLMKHIHKIFLYSKPEYNTLVATFGDLDNAEIEDLSPTAIKVAHFDYNYSLCDGIPNNSQNEGKLTLERLYFTYQNSNMGMYSPYNFNYSEFNPEYNLKGYDIWGNYKENKAEGCDVNNDPLTNSEFPFVEQDKDIADENTGAWMLESIDLPSGGKLEIETESDDYQYVQNKKAMQMFKINGFSDTEDPFDFNEILYNGANHKEYIVVKISEDELNDYDETSFINDYLSENADKPIYFRALVNMVHGTLSQSDYVSGYFEIDFSKDVQINNNVSGETGTFVAIPLVMLEAEGGWVPGGGDVNPIAKAGWYFGRSYLNREVYSIGGNTTNTDFVAIVEELVSSIDAVFEIFTGPNIKLQNKQCAKEVILDKSWIRLENPSDRKFGGGLRVKKIELHDQWSYLDEDPDNDTDNPYNQFYGQEYNYNLDNNTSSGVATFEPNASKENPFVEPFYDNPGNAKDQLVAPKESNYTEKPLGESFFPAAKVTYSKVTVKNLERIDGNLIVKKHATGKVINEFYTSQNFPTLTDHTKITPLFDPPGPLSNIFNLNVKNHLTFSQGFVIETNDMDGRVKSQRVYPENQDAAISGVDYIYNTTTEGKLSSSVFTIDKDGSVQRNEVGLTYDVFNDFRESYSQSETFGIDFNLAGFVIFIIPIVIPLPLPDYAYHETKLRTAATTKVIHRSAILKEKIAYDVGSQVSTKNIAWDASTGQILLTETVNEYNNHYFNFTYPSHWYYDGMGMASQNLGIEGDLTKTQNNHEYTLDDQNIDPASIFKLGDEILTYPLDDPSSLERFWVVQKDANNIVLMDKDGAFANDICDAENLHFKIVRSGYRNQQMASMASVTSMTNPIDLDDDGYGPDGNGVYYFDNINEDTYLFTNDFNPKIINASAVAYSEAWALQWENNLPSFPSDLDLDGVTYGDSDPNIEPFKYNFNPYLYNVRGEWRAKQSYAYLTNRISNTSGESSPRHEGFFKQFNPFYRINSSNWQIGTTNWTSASQVTQYSPFGAELENKDALERYSAAQYGYNYNLPIAVASNSEYREIGFDGFEDFEYQNENPLVDRDSHFSFYNIDPTPNASLNSDVSHTGTSSLAVTGETSLEIKYDQECYKATYDGPDDCDPDPDPDITITGSGEECWSDIYDVWEDKCEGTCEGDIDIVLNNIPNGQTASLNFNWSLQLIDSGNPAANELKVAIGDTFLETVSGGAPINETGTYTLSNVSNGQVVAITMYVNASGYCDLWQAKSSVTLTSATVNGVSIDLTGVETVFEVILNGDVE